MRCVLLSETLDLRRLFGPALAGIADRLEIVDDDGGVRPDIPLALAWKPAPDSFARYPGLRALCSIGAGADSLLACPGLPSALDIVRVVDPHQAEAMAGFVAWHVIGHQRRFADYATNQRAAAWRRLNPRRPGDVPVGLLGYGHMGRRVGAALAVLGFPVLAWGRTEPTTVDPGDPAARFHGAAGLDAMLSRSEVLVNLLPLTAETSGILDAGLFRRMRPGAYLVQVGRGEHLAETDLIAALDDGHLAGAALDVFATEPLPAHHPFWRHPGITLTPHEACEAGPEAVASTLLATSRALREGRRPPDAIDRARGY